MIRFKRGVSGDILAIFNWASEASPTLGCSIEISRDIYIYLRASERSERSEHIVVVSSRFYYKYIYTMVAAVTAMV